MAKVLVATEKPFASMAVKGIKDVLDAAGFDLILLENYKGEDELIKAAENVDAIIIRSDLITANVIESAKNLKIVVRAGAGYDNIDLAAATKNNVVAMNTPEQNSNAVAELALGMMLFMARNSFNGKPGTELKGKKLGIHAYGFVGKSIAKVAKGFGMKLYAHDPFVTPIAIENDDVISIEEMADLYSTCQYVSINIPATPKTIKSINYELMAQMPIDAVLLNTARKEVIDEEGLLKMFEKRKDFKYVSDIAPDCKEEIAAKYPGRFFFTPKKMGAQTEEANTNAGIAAAKQIVNFLKNGNTMFQVNKKA